MAASTGKLLAIVQLYMMALSSAQVVNEYQSGICIRETFRYRYDIASKADDFETLVAKSNVFVDKSLFVKEILDNIDDVVLIMRPRKWGKSINLSMLKAFLEIPVDPKNGHRISLDNSTNYRLFKYGEVSNNDVVTKLKKPFLISKYENLLKNYLCKHPVVLVSFGNLRGNTFMELVASVTQTLSELYAKHMYLKDELEAVWKNESISYSQRKKARLKKEYFEKIISQRAGVQDVKDGLFFLTRILSRKFDNQSVFVLIDDYDTVLHNIFFKKNVRQSHKIQFHNFFVRFMEFTFKMNTYYAKGVITGVQSLFEPRVFSNILNTSRITCLDEAFSRFFGFSDTESDLLFEQLSIPPVLTSLARQRYRINGTGPTPSYNPYSIASFVSYRNVRDFWTETGSADMFLKPFFVLPTFRDQITNLINGYIEYIAHSNLFMRSDDFIELQKFFDDSEESYEEVGYVRNAGLSMFFSNGYLTLGDGLECIESVLGVKPNTSNESYIPAKIPNNEIRDEIKMKFLKYCAYHLNIDIDHPPQYLIDDFENFVKNLHGSNVTLLTKSFNEFLKARPRGVDVAVSSWVYALLKYLVIQIDPLFEKFVNEATPDTPDVVLRKPNYAVIIEFSVKATNAKKPLQDARDYEDKYKIFKKIKTLKFIGIRVFANKTVHISPDLRIKR